MSTNGLSSRSRTQVYFPIGEVILDRHVGDIKAVDDVSLEIGGARPSASSESPECGKSTVGR